VNSIGFRLYEGCRPDVPPGVEGRGAKAKLDIEKILRDRKTRPHRAATGLARNSATLIRCRLYGYDAFCMQLGKWQRLLFAGLLPYHARRPEPVGQKQERTDR
jgi:hypothetical protein